MRRFSSIVQSTTAAMTSGWNRPRMPPGDTLGAHGENEFTYAI